jgi:hypothetical protein
VISRFNNQAIHLLNSPASVRSGQPERCRAARYVLAHAADAADAALLLSLLGLEPTEALSPRIQEV